MMVFVTFKVVTMASILGFSARLHPLVQIWSLLSPVNQIGDSRNAKLNLKTVVTKQMIGVMVGLHEWLKKQLLTQRRFEFVSHRRHHLARLK